MKTACSLALVILLGACSEDDAGGTDASDVADAADVIETADSAGDSAGDLIPDSDAAPDGEIAGIVLVDDPILERASLGTATCTLERDVTQFPHGEFQTEFQIESAIAAGSSALVTRAWPKFSLARLELDGTFSDEVFLDNEDYAASQSATAVDAGSIAVVFVKIDQRTNAGGLHFVKVGLDDFAIDVPVKDLGLGEAGFGSVQSTLAADGAGGWALVYNDSERGNALTFVKLAADGTPGAKVVVAEGSGDGIGYSQSFIKTAAGQYAVTWTDGPYDAAEVFFARIDPSGRVVSGPHRISRAGGGGYSSGVSFRVGGGALLEVGDRFWAVFNEAHTTGVEFVDQKTSVVARVAVIDGDGNGELHQVQAPVEHKTTEAPTLHRFGDELGVLWSYGTVIYICAGCIADYDLHFVLIDPASKRPVSGETIAVSESNGYRNPRAVVLGDELLVTTAIDFHALWYPAHALFACVGN